MVLIKVKKMMYTDQKYKYEISVTDQVKFNMIFCVKLRNHCLVYIFLSISTTTAGPAPQRRTDRSHNVNIDRTTLLPVLYRLQEVIKVTRLFTM